MFDTRYFFFFFRRGRLIVFEDYSRTAVVQFFGIVWRQGLIFELNRNIYIYVYL